MKASEVSTTQRRIAALEKRRDELTKLLALQHQVAALELQCCGNDETESQSATIIVTVAECFKVPKDELRSRSRVHHICIARMVSMYLLKELLGLSYSEIGRRLGKDHSGVMYSYRAIRDRLEVDRRFCSQMEQTRAAVLSRLGGNKTNDESLRLKPPRGDCL